MLVYMELMEFCHRFKMMVNLFIYLLVYIAFNSQGHIATGSLQVEKTSAYCTVNHWASGISYQLSNMKHPAQDSNWWPQSLEARSLTATPPSPLDDGQEKEERRFILRTDHASLKWLVNFKEPVGMLARYSVPMILKHIIARGRYILLLMVYLGT